MPAQAPPNLSFTPEPWGLCMGNSPDLAPTCSPYHLVGRSRDFASGVDRPARQVANASSNGQLTIARSAVNPFNWRSNGKAAERCRARERARLLRQPGAPMSRTSWSPLAAFRASGARRRGSSKDFESLQPKQHTPYLGMLFGIDIVY